MRNLSCLGDSLEAWRRALDEAVVRAFDEQRGEVSFVASAMPSSGPSTISAVSNASARTASASMTVTDASRCVNGRPVRGSRMCATRWPSISRYFR
jgi:hypothetical protein